MKALTLCILCILFLGTTFCASAEPPDSFPEAPAVQAALQQFKQVYSAKLIIGDVLEINGLQIIPLATVGFGVAPFEAGDDASQLPGVGGLMMPVGVIVVSGQSVRIVQISKGFVEQIVSVLAPTLLQFMGEREGIQAGQGLQQQTLPKNVPKDRSVLAGYLRTALILWIVWAVLAFLIQRYFPDKIAAIASGFRYRAVQISLLGLAGLGIMFLLAIIFTVSLIGIPFTFALFLLGGMLTLFGSIGLALFIGQQSATAFKYHYSETRLMLIGGGLFGLLGMIPLLGILTWALVAIFGFGAVLQIQRENLHKRSL